MPTMSIRQRLTSGTLFLFSLLLLCAGLGIFQLGRLSRDAQAILKDNYETARFVQDMQAALSRNDREAFDAALRKQEANITEPGESDVTKRLREDFKAWQADDAAIRRIQNHLQHILDLNLDAIERKNAAAMTTAQRARKWLWGIAALVLVVGLAFSLGFPRQVTQPIQRLRHAVEELSEGNYRHRVPAFRSDELGALSEAFNRMAAKLEEWENSNLARVMTEKARAEAALNSLEDAGFGVDPEGVILFVNRKATELLGMSEPELTGQKAAVIAERNDLMKRVLNLPGGAPFKAVVDGREQFFAHARMPIEGASGTLGTIHLLRNITPFQERDQAKTMFLATISHELKTPLASSDIGLGILERKHLPVMEAEARGIISDLRKDHQRLVRIVSELLDLTQVETGNIRINLTEQAIEPLIDRAVDAVHRLGERKDIRFDLGFTSPNLWVKVDADKAVWVLVNVLGNAVRHSPRQGVIAVQASATDGQVRVSVADQGPGLTPEESERLFQRYAPGSGPEHGTGLGLAIAREFTMAMGGDIKLASTSAAGATFQITFPGADGPVA